MSAAGGGHAGSGSGGNGSFGAGQTRGELRERRPVVPVDDWEARSTARSMERWEFMGILIWDDDSKSSITSDLEDVEVLNTLGAEGWELVCVVPLARTQVLEMAYPGNTRKLLAYLKRPAV